MTDASAEDPTPPAGAALNVANALVWREGRILVSRRRNDTHLGGYWEFPGGKIEPGECARECAVREVLEEVGVKCLAESERRVIEYAYPERTVRLQPVDCRYLSGEAECLEVVEVRWVLPTELRRLTLPPANKALVADLTSASL